VWFSSSLDVEHAEARGTTPKYPAAYKTATADELGASQGFGAWHKLGCGHSIAILKSSDNGQTRSDAERHGQAAC
jgi:hypothetical protein